MRTKVTITVSTVEEYFNKKNSCQFKVLCNNPVWSVIDIVSCLHCLLFYLESFILLGRSKIPEFYCSN